MAENNNNNLALSNNKKNGLGEEEKSDESETEDYGPLELDLGDELSRKVDTNRLGNQNSGNMSGDNPRREDNPFSFKHFLRADSNSQNQNKGARPKVFCEGRRVSEMNRLPSASSLKQQNRMVPEYSSALPDFVQDHLIVEQCYLGGQAANNYDLDVNNLPDFTPDRSSTAKRRNDGDSSRKDRETPVPLDLPVRPQTGFPLDLPAQQNARNVPAPSEVGVSKSLPDFLADGAAHSQSNDGLPTVPSPERETDRLRHELETARRQLNEQNRRADMLGLELELARNKEHEYTQNLAKALEQVEENLERSNRRAASAENTIVKLRQEIKALVAQINHLKLENRSLRAEEGAAGGPGHLNPPSEQYSQRLAQELRTAASTAEHSLRQLLTGVDNLRIMASTLENMHRIEETCETFLNLDDDSSSGPAL